MPDEEPCSTKSVLSHALHPTLFMRRTQGGLHAEAAVITGSIGQIVAQGRANSGVS